jgi:hypothetical protein
MPEPCVSPDFGLSPSPSEFGAPCSTPVLGTVVAVTSPAVTGTCCDANRYAVCTLQGPDAPLDLNITILVIGLRGTGKTQLIHSLLGMSSSSSSGSANSSSSSTAALEPFGGGTRRVEVHRGRFLGVGLTLVDTPGLTSSAAGAGANAGVLRSIKAAFRKHQPDLVLYVDR